MIKKVIKIVLVVSVVAVVIFLGINTQRIREKKTSSPKIFIGFPKGQTGIIKEYEIISKEYQYIEKGNEYLQKGEIDKAIEQYNIVLKRNKKTGALLSAIRGLINAHEKARDYKTAAALLEKKISTFKIPPSDKFRIPADERLKYLKYAANGDYKLAIEHAQKALETDNKLPNRPKSGSPKYIERLNDLIAAKEYILSLKKSN